MTPVQQQFPNLPFPLKENVLRALFTPYYPLPAACPHTRRWEKRKLYWFPTHHKGQILTLVQSKNNACILLSQWQRSVPWIEMTSASIADGTYIRKEQHKAHLLTWWKLQCPSAENGDPPHTIFPLFRDVWLCRIKAASIPASTAAVENSFYLSPIHWVTIHLIYILWKDN